MRTTTNAKQHLHITMQHDVSLDTHIDVTGLVYRHEASIITMRSMQIGTRQHTMMVVLANWNHINMINSALAKLHQPDHDIYIQTHTAQIDPSDTTRYLSYYLNIIARDEEDVVESLQKFLLLNELDCETMTVENYSTLENSLSSVMMINAKIRIDSSLSLSNIREQFLLFCDNLNIDGILDPIRPY